MRAFVGIALIAIAAGLLKWAIDRGFWYDTVYADAAVTVAIIVFAVLLVEEGLVLLRAVDWAIGR